MFKFTKTVQGNDFRKQNTRSALGSKRTSENS